MADVEDLTSFLKEYGGARARTPSSLSLASTEKINQQWSFYMYLLLIL
jgi:hypothetical protein